MKMRGRILGMLLCVALAALVGCGAKETAESGGETKEGTAKEESAEASEDGKVIRIGCEATTPGWIQTGDDGSLQGYDFDVWQEIGKRTGYEIDYQVMDWDAMWPMLESDRLDSVGEQISVTQEREKKYTFSTPYAYNVYCLLAAKDNEKLKSMEDLATGMTISCESNTSDEIIVNAINKEYGIELEPTYYDGMSVQDVALGRCDLWPRAETSCNTTVKEVGNLKILGKTDILETNAYPFAKTERGEELAKVVSEALDGMREDGTLKTLSEKWFDIDISEKPADAQ